MSSALGLTVILYALVLGLLCLAAAVRGGERPVLVGVGLVVLGLGAALLGLLDVVDLLRGRHGDEEATNLAYAGTTVLALPVVAAATRLEQSRWGSACLAAGCLVLAVLALRLHQTLGAERA